MKSKIPLKDPRKVNLAHYANDARAHSHVTGRENVIVLFTNVFVNGQS